MKGNVCSMIKKYQPIIICSLAVLLLFVFIEGIKFISISSTENKQESEQILDNHPEDEQDATDQIEAINDSDKDEEDEDEDEDATSVEEDGKFVYLTFDDGPSSVTTEILDTLEQFNAKATFFMLEPAMRSYPEAVKRTVEDGHAVALHGVTHQKEKFYHSEQSALDEMKTAQETLLNITGVQSYLIRTPYGSIPYLTDSFRKVLTENGFKIWDWNVDSSDWNLSKDQYVQNVIAQVEKIDKSGGTPIILMHDRGETAHHLSTLLSYLQKHDFQTRIIDENLESYQFNCYDRCYRLDGGN